MKKNSKSKPVIIRSSSELTSRAVPSIRLNRKEIIDIKRSLPSQEFKSSQTASDFFTILKSEEKK